MKTLFVGQNSIHLKSVDSTNRYASELLRHVKLSEGSLIYTFEQQKGRGQRGNGWVSEPNKNITLSLVLYPHFLSIEKQFLLTEIAALSVADLMSELLDPINQSCTLKIKWPNDIYVDGKKMAGILIENTWRENTIQSSIFGIGINVNQVEFNSDLNALSLRMLTGKEFDLIQLINRLCEFIEARYLQLKANKHADIHVAYLNKLYKLNQWANFSANGQTITGKITGISAVGKLKVETATGEIKEFDLKEITFI